MESVEIEKDMEIQDVISNVQLVNRVLEVETVLDEDLYLLDLKSETEEFRNREARFAELERESKRIRKCNKILKEEYRENLIAFHEKRAEPIPPIIAMIHRLLHKINFSREMCSILLGTVPAGKQMLALGLAAKICGQRGFQYYVLKVKDGDGGAVA